MVVERFGTSAAVWAHKVKTLSRVRRAAMRRTFQSGRYQKKYMYWQHEAAPCCLR